MKIRIALCLDESDDPQATADLGGGMVLSAENGIALVDSGSLKFKATKASADVAPVIDAATDPAA